MSEVGLTYIRELHNMTMQELADRLNISKQMVSMWESGKKTISDERLKDLSKLFDIPQKYFLNELDEINKIKVQRHKMNKEYNDQLAKLGYSQERIDEEYEDDMELPYEVQKILDEQEEIDEYFSEYISRITVLERIKKSINQESTDASREIYEVYSDFNYVVDYLVQQKRIDIVFVSQLLRVLLQESGLFDIYSVDQAFHRDFRELLRKYKIIKKC